MKLFQILTLPAHFVQIMVQSVLVMIFYYEIVIKGSSSMSIVESKLWASLHNLHWNPYSIFVLNYGYLFLGEISLATYMKYYLLKKPEVLLTLVFPYSFLS